MKKTIFGKEVDIDYKRDLQDFSSAQKVDEETIEKYISSAIDNAQKSDSGIATIASGDRFIFVSISKYKGDVKTRIEVLKPLYVGDIFTTE